MNDKHKANFDGLADDYERYRPRYPQELIKTLLKTLHNYSGLTIVDVGAGTGIALEHIINTLGDNHNYHGVDISIDMINKGKQKFPNIKWHLGKAEEVLVTFEDIDLIIVAQSFQWMDRPKLLSTIKPKLKPEGIIGIIQNNRNFRNSSFLDQYETLLEEMSPNYSRNYRDFDFQNELAEGLDLNKNEVKLYTNDWIMQIPSKAFVGMSRSSTQAQRAIEAHGMNFIDRLAKLIEKHEKQEILDIPYHSELFMYVKS